MDRMNPFQRQAIDALEGPLLLLAGAGSGKTTVIVHRIANLIAHRVAPEHILAVTFTNKAAKEMRERMQKLVGPTAAARLTISTFHAFCNGVLRRHIHTLGYSRSFSIATDSYRSGLMREIMTALQMIGPGRDLNRWLREISLAKANLEDPEDFRRKKIPDAAEISMAYGRYQARMKQMDMVDFDDLLNLAVQVWQRNPPVLEAYRRKFTHLMIDEYQDTNAVQLRLMVLLAGEAKNIAVVGDDDQSIYGWRGADLSNILDFERFFPGARVIRLEQNYRSTNNILNAANALIARNGSRRPKNLWSEQGDGDPIGLVRCRTATEEAEFIARYVRELCLDERWEDTAVLFRSNTQSRLLEEKFRRMRIPYVLVGADSFYQTKEVMDAISFLQAVQNPQNDLDFLRIVDTPARGIGEVTIGRLRDCREVTGIGIQEIAVSPEILRELSPESAKALTRFTDILAKYREIFREPGDLYRKTMALYDELEYLQSMGRMYKPRENALARRDNVVEFVRSLKDFEEHRHGACTLQQYLDLFCLRDALDKQEKGRDARRNAVTLMTVHAAKGLEYRNVVVAGMEQGVFPHQRALDEGGLEEERRLAYVAITRARRTLTLTYAQKRKIKGQVRTMIPSRFLEEIPDRYTRLLKPEEAFAPASEDQAADMFARLKEMLQS